MARKCDICGKRGYTGRKYARHGKAKREGGVGIKVGGITNRTFKVNLQSVRALVDGKTERLRVCTKCIRSGRVVKPMAKAPAKTA